MAGTMFEKIWDAHVVHEQDGNCILYIDRHLVHEVTSPQAFEGLKLAALSFGKDIAKVPFEVKDSYIQVPTTPGIGIDLDEDRLANYPYQPFPARSPRQYYEEGP